MKSGCVIFTFFYAFACLNVPEARAVFKFNGTVLHSPYAQMDSFPQSITAYKNRLLGSDLGSYNNGTCASGPGQQLLSLRNATVYDFVVTGTQNFTRQVLSTSTVSLSGFALAMNNGSAVFGSPNQNLAYQYLYDGSSFHETDKLIPVPDTYSCYGSAVAMTRHWLAIAAPYTWREKFGRVYIYKRVQGAWHFIQVLTPDNKKHAVHFGQRIVMNDYLLAVTGSPYENPEGRFQDVYVYYPEKDKWLQQGKSVRQQVDTEESSAIAVVKDRLVVRSIVQGAPSHQIVLYEYKAGRWELRNSVLELSGNGFGNNLQTIDDHTLLVSNPEQEELLVFSVQGGELEVTQERISSPDANLRPGFGDLTAYSQGMLYVAVQGSTALGDSYPGKVYVFKHYPKPPQ